MCCYKITNSKAQQNMFKRTQLLRGTWKYHQLLRSSICSLVDILCLLGSLIDQTFNSKVHYNPAMACTSFYFDKTPSEMGVAPEAISGIRLDIQVVWGIEQPKVLIDSSTGLKQLYE